MAEPTSCCAEPRGYCARVDTLFNLAGVHVLDVGWHEDRGGLPAGLRLVVETGSAEAGCPGCGVIAEARGRRSRRLHDIPAFGAPVELLWRQRSFWCLELVCPVRGFSEDHGLTSSRAKLTVRAAWWALSCIQRDNASVASIARRLGVDWHTVWEAIKPLLEQLADDPNRLVGVDAVGVDEHIWHHQPRSGKGPREQTGIVDLTRRNGKTKARLAAGLGAGPVREGLCRLAAFPRERLHRQGWHRHAGSVSWLRRAPRGASDSGGVEGPTAGLSQQSGEAEGSRAGGGAPVGWEAALTTPGRSSTARWAGSGKRGRQGATGVNRWLKPLKLWNRLESGGSGPGSSAHRPTRVVR